MAGRRFVMEMVLLQGLLRTMVDKAATSVATEVISCRRGRGDDGGDWTAGGGGGDGDAFAGGAHGEGGGWGHVHVELGGELESPQLLHLLLQPSVLFRQVLAAPLQELAIHLRLLQLCPAHMNHRTSSLTTSFLYFHD